MPNNLIFNFTNGVAFTKEVALNLKLQSINAIAATSYDIKQSLKKYLSIPNEHIILERCEIVSGGKEVYCVFVINEELSSPSIIAKYNKKFKTDTKSTGSIIVGKDNFTFATSEQTPITEEMAIQNSLYRHKSVWLKDLPSKWLEVDDEDTIDHNHFLWKIVNEHFHGVIGMDLRQNENNELSKDLCIKFDNPSSFIRIVHDFQLTGNSRVIARRNNVKAVFLVELDIDTSGYLSDKKVKDRLLIKNKSAKLHSKLEDKIAQANKYLTKMTTSVKQDILEKESKYQELRQPRIKEAYNNMLKNFEKLEQVITRVTNFSIKSKITFEDENEINRDFHDARKYMDRIEDDYRNLKIDIDKFIQKCKELSELEEKEARVRRLAALTMSCQALVVDAQTVIRSTVDSLRVHHWEAQGNILFSKAATMCKTLEKILLQHQQGHTSSSNSTVMKQTDVLTKSSEMIEVEMADINTAIQMMRTLCIFQEFLAENSSLDTSLTAVVEPRAVAGAAMGRVAVVDAFKKLLHLSKLLINTVLENSFTDGCLHKLKVEEFSSKLKAITFQISQYIQSFIEAIQKLREIQEVEDVLVTQQKEILDNQKGNEFLEARLRQFTDECLSAHSFRVQALCEIVLNLSSSWDCEDSSSSLLKDFDISFFDISLNDLENFKAAVSTLSNIFLREAKRFEYDRIRLIEDFEKRKKEAEAEAARIAAELAEHERKLRLKLIEEKLNVLKSETNFASLPDASQSKRREDVVSRRDSEVASCMYRYISTETFKAFERLCEVADENEDTSTSRKRKLDLVKDDKLEYESTRNVYFLRPIWSNRFTVSDTYSSAETDQKRPKLMSQFLDPIVIDVNQAFDGEEEGKGRETEERGEDANFGGGHENPGNQCELENEEPDAREIQAGDDSNSIADRENVLKNLLLVKSLKKKLLLQKESKNRASKNI